MTYALLRGLLEMDLVDPYIAISQWYLCYHFWIFLNNICSWIQITAVARDHAEIRRDWGWSKYHHKQLYIDTTIHRPRQLIQVHQKILLSSQLFTTDIKFPPSKVREYSRVCGRKRKFSQCFVNILKNTSIIEKYIIECWVFRLTDNNVAIFCDL